MGASGKIAEQRSPYGERHHLVECQCAECYPPTVEPIDCLAVYPEMTWATIKDGGNE